MSISDRLTERATDRSIGRSTRPEASTGPTDSGSVEIVDLSDTHHDWVARLHVAELPHGLFPRLGRRFVARWHQAHVASPHGVGYVALRDGAPVGFALGCHDRAANVSWILAHRRGRLALAGALALAVRPRLAVSFLQTRAARYLRRLVGRPAAPPGSHAGAPAGPVAVLEAIVVLPGVRITGIGSSLLEVFLTETARAGVEHVELVTKAGDEGAAGFYRKRGWEQVSRHVDRDGDAVLRLRTRLDPPHR